MLVSIAFIVVLAATIIHGRPLPEGRHHRKRHSPRELRDDVSARCNYATGTVLKEFPPDSGVWTELSLYQRTTYDRCGNIIQRVQWWQVPGNVLCWSIAERCNWTGTACQPASHQKFKFGNCTWGSNNVCRPYTHPLHAIRNGTWVRFGEELQTQCPKDGIQSGQQQIRAGGRGDQTPNKRPRMEEAAAAGHTSGAGASSGNTGVTAVDLPRFTATSPKECFMKNPTKNTNPGDCTAASRRHEPALQTMAVLATFPADYSEDPVDNEADLLLARGDGIFHWEDYRDVLGNIFVCEKHFFALGAEWKKNRPKKAGGNRPKCNAPEMEGTPGHQTSVIGDRFVTKEESEALWAIKRLFVPLGTSKHA
jgi:hypothetical protein